MQLANWKCQIFINYFLFFIYPNFTNSLSILEMVLGKMPPRKIPPKKCPLENFPPENFSPRKIVPRTHGIFCEFFLVSNFYVYGNVHLQLKSIFIQFIFLIISNNFFGLYFSFFFFLMRIFLIFSYFQHYIDAWPTMLGNVK